jgi:chromosome segregation ATPase
MRLKYTVQSQDKRLIEAAELLVAANSNIDEHELNSTNKNFELAQVSNSLNLANEKLSRSEIAINDLNGQITTLTLTIKTTETDSNETIACLNGNIATQQKHLTQLEVKHDALKDSNLSMKDKLTTLFEENTRLSEKFKKSEADLEIAEMNFIHKERSLSDLNTRYSELSTDYIELKSHSVELENTVSNLNEDIEIAASKTEMIEIELTAKSSKIDSLYLAESELQSELSSINEKNCLLEKDVLFSNEKLKESQLCINELRSESSDLTAANQQYQSNLNSKIIEFSNLQEEYFSNTKQLLHLKDEKSRVEYDLSSSQDFLAECEISLASAREAALNAESLRKNSEENYKFQKEKNCNLEITLTQTRSILDEKASEITILNHNYQIQGKNYESQLDVKCIELNAQCQKLGDLTTKIQQLDRELQDSKLKILSRDNESKDMQLKIDGLHNKIKLRDLDTDNQITEMKNEHQILLQSFADKEKDLKKSEVELNSYNQELTDKIEMQASTFKRNISELEDKYNGTIKSKEKCLASAQNKCSHYALELEKLRDNTKKEFMEKNIEISQLKAKIENDLAISGSIIRDITTKLAEKSKDLKQAEIDKIDAKNNVAMIELKLTNEVTSNEIQIRSLDGKLKDCNKQMMKMNEKLHIYENENLITKEAYKKLELEMKELEDKKLKYKKDNQIQTEERKMYENRIAEVEAQVNTWTNNSEE